MPIRLTHNIRISQRQMYHRTSFVGQSYLPIMSFISKFMGVPIGIIDRKHKTGQHELAYVVISHNYLSNYIILSYLLKYPLLTYKYTNISVQIELLKLTESKLYKSNNGIILFDHLKLLMYNYSVLNLKNHIYLNGPYYT